MPVKEILKSVPQSKADLKHENEKEKNNSHNDQDLFIIPRFSTLSLSIVWILAFIVALAAGVLADVFQSSAPSFPLGPTIHLSVGLNSICALLSILLGYSLWDSYSIYQPFAGGERYVLLQGCGWTIIASCSSLMVIYLIQLQFPIYRYGALSILEVFASIGNIFLVVSLRFFIPSQARRESKENLIPNLNHGKSEKCFLKSMLESPNSESGLVIIFLLSQLFLCNIGAVFKSISSSAMIIFTIFHIFNGILIYTVIGWENKKGYKIFTGPIETLYLVLFWVLYLISLAGGISLIRIGNNAPQIAFGMTALSTFLGISSMLLLLRTREFKQNTTPIVSVVVSYGRLALSATAAGMVCVTIGIMYYVKSQNSHFKESKNGKAWIDGLLLCQTLSVLFLLILTPVTHLTGRIIYGDLFSFFQPFRGTPGFIILQGLGWASFSISILSMTFHMTATDFRWILFAASTGVMGQFFIQFSIEAFASDCSNNNNNNNNNNNITKEPIEEIKEEIIPNVEVANILNGELIVAFLLQFTSIILRLIVDISAIQQKENYSIPKETLIGFSSIAFLVSVPLAHFSGKDKGISFFSPFQGTGTYIALQALGWTVYALFAVKSLLSLFSSSNGVESLRLIPENIPTLWFTLEGFLQTVPLLLIVLSVITEFKSTALKRRGHDVVIESLGLVKKMLEKQLNTIDANEKVELQKAMRILAISSLSAHGIIYDGRSFRLKINIDDITSATTEDELNNNNNDDDDEENLPVFSTEAETRQGAATLLVLMLCFASSVCYMISALWSSILPFMGLILTLVGFGISTISCISMHCIYGLLLHGYSGEYTFFMPFKGGPVYIALQIAGWSSYSCTFIITLMHTLEDFGNQIILPVGALFSIFSQLFILASIPKFNTKRRRRTYLEENGEGVVAMLVFLGAFVFAHLYLRAQELFLEDENYINYNDNNSTYINNISSKKLKVPFFIIALSMVAAVPCILITLSRSAKRWVKVAESPIHENGVNEECQLERHKSILANMVVKASELMILALGTVTPSLLIFLINYIVHSHQNGLLRILEYWFPISIIAGTFALLLPLLPDVVSHGVLMKIKDIKVCIGAYTAYSVPVVCSVVLYGPVFILPFHSVGAYYYTLSAMLLCCGASFSQLRMLIRFGIYAALGYATYIEYLRIIESKTTFSAFTSLGYYAVDFIILMIWLCYLPLYDGKPEETGAQRSLKFTKWSEKYLFSNAEKYFNFRVIADDDSVNVRDPKNQYIFSFHPHGVFPGTALFGPLTHAWREKMGFNNTTRLVTHAASVVFNVPLVRDFNLRLGVLAVTRAAIEGNLSRGHSSIIVTGGQAELALTRYSYSVMSLVAYHKGFIRLAVKHKIPLVPLLCFAEQNVMDTIQFPRLHRATLRLFGFPFPMLPHGRWLLPLPNRTPLTLVVGGAVTIPAGANPDNQEDVDALTEVYFNALKKLFYKHRAAAGYPEMELVFYTRKGAKED